MDSESKRLKSVKEMIQRRKQQTNAIRAALKNVDLKPKRKTFGSDDEENEELVNFGPKSSSKEDKVQKDSKRKRKNPDEKLTLFGSDDEGNDNGSGNFKLKSSLQESNFQKILEAGAEPRFMLPNRRHLLDEEDDNESPEEAEKGETPTQDAESEEISMMEEKQNELRILNKVLGHADLPTAIVAGRDAEDKISRKHGNLQGMVRYDPNFPEHSKFVVQTDKKTETAAAKVGKKKKADREKEKKVDLPEVSKEVFYKVTDNIKESLQDKQEFNLLALYGRSEESLLEHDPSTPEISTEKNRLAEFSPFGNEPEHSEKLETQTRTLLSSAWKPNIFFLRKDDYRVQEGLDFIKKMTEEHSSEFDKIRRDIKEITRTKIRHVQRKNRPFRNKIGGGKRRKIMKIKKAVNR